MSTLVTVVIPTYGRPDYLPRAVESALNQTYTNIEVIVVDDNGDGGAHRAETEAVISCFMHDNRVKYIKHEKNKNGSAARNTGLKAASGTFIGFLDDDDELLPTKIEKQLRMLLMRPEYGAVYCLNTLFYKGAQIRSTSYTTEGDCTFDILSLRSDIHTSSLLLRKERVEEIGGFDESFYRHQEYEFMIRFFERNWMCCVPEILLHAHIDSNMNRPGVDRQIEVKRHYFEKMARFIGKYSEVDRATIVKVHNLVLFRTCLKNMDARAIKYLLMSNPSMDDVIAHLLPFAKKYWNMLRVSVRSSWRS